MQARREFGSWDRPWTAPGNTPPILATPMRQQAAQDPQRVTVRFQGAVLFAGLDRTRILTCAAVTQTIARMPAPGCPEPLRVHFRL